MWKTDSTPSVWKIIIDSHFLNMLLILKQFLHKLVLYINRDLRWLNPCLVYYLSTSDSFAAEAITMC